MSVKILCKLVTQNTDPDVFLSISYSDSSGNKRYELLPIELTLDERKLKTWLIKRNFPQQFLHASEWTSTLKKLREPITKTGMIVEKTGYLNKSYILPDGSIIGPQEEHTVYLNPKKTLFRPQCGTSGLLEEWQEKVAASALHSTRIMLGLCIGFSGYLLEIIKTIESGGINLFGRSSIGKTTVLKIMISISGPRCNLQSWNSTDTGIEELAYGHNDNFIAFDELKTLDQDPKKAAQKLTSVIYRLCSGIDKKRAGNYKRDQYHWRISILSTGEYSFAEHALQGGSKRLLGEEVRVIDVPADAGKELGIFESIPEGYTDASSYVQYLDEQSQQYYGTAQAAFLEKLIAEINEEDAEQTVKDQLDEWMEKFRSKCGVDLKLGTAVRFANRFALACAAGCLAVKYGVLPFTRKDVFEGISACYKAALSMKPESWEEQVTRYDEKLSDYLKSKEFPALDSQESWSKKEIERNDGFSHTINGIQLIVLKPDVVKSLISEFYLKDVLSDCKSEGYLLPGADGSNTRSIALNGKKVRHYCFVCPRDKSNIAAAKKLIKGYSIKMKQNNKK